MFAGETTMGKGSGIGRHMRQQGRRFGSLLVIFGAAGFAAVWPLRALPATAGNSPQDRFLQIYVEIQNADRAAGQGYYTKAAQQYREAQAALEKLQEAYPNWERQIVEYRLGYVRKQLAEVEKRMAGGPAASANPPGSPVEGRLQELEDKLAKLEASQENIADKAAVNRQLFELRDLLRNLQGELSELKAARAKQLAEDAAIQAEIAKIGSLSGEVAALRAQLAELNKEGKNREESARLQKRLEDLEGQLARARTAQEKAKERRAVEEKMKELGGQVVTLQAELSRVKAAQEAAAQAAGGGGQGAERVIQLEATVQRLESQLAQAQKEQRQLQAESPQVAQFQEVAQLRSQMERLQAELTRLQAKKEIRRLETTTTANSSEVAALKDRVRKLEDELARTRQREERLLTSVTSQRNDLQARVADLQAEMNRSRSTQPASAGAGAGGRAAAREEAEPPPSSRTAWTASTGHAPATEEPFNPAPEETAEEQPDERPATAARNRGSGTNKTVEGKRKAVRHRRGGSSVEEEVIRGIHRVRRQIANLIGG
ncbi:hypothetical protein [Methylacidimicrobium sp. AP8]|uniref:hypothetical protein n=1 Tax=Methylacidimicrobium sp. AP8 TaxID=2730359 RepID=UPI001923B6F8|nr:hypothetical protein [Methylacidimicrobium sp. AP8]